MKTLKSIGLTAILAVACMELLGGCSTLKNMAPNSWNVTYYEPTDGDKSGQTIAVGVSGALPWGKQ